MKLYTEEEVKKALYDSFMCTYAAEVSKIMSKLNHIQLPSDDEIYKESLKNEHWYENFNDGAKWMRNKIGGNNE